MHSTPAGVHDGEAQDASDDGVGGGDVDLGPGGEGLEGTARPEGQHEAEGVQVGTLARIEASSVCDTSGDSVDVGLAESHGSGELEDGSDEDGLVHGEGAWRTGSEDATGDTGKRFTCSH